MTAAAAIQPFAQLDADTEDALRASIKRFGVVVPIVVDATGRIIDGHHRSRIAKELNLECPQIRRAVRSDDDANALAYTLNADRRHMTRDQRLAIVADLRAQGFSLRAIAGAVGIDKRQVQRDLSYHEVGTVSPPANVDPETGEIRETGTAEVREVPGVAADVTQVSVSTTRVTGRDGKSYPAKANPSTSAAAIEQRRKDIAKLAETGMTSGQIAKALGVARNTVLEHAKAIGVKITADALVANVRKPDANVVMENTVQMAVDLTAGLDALVDFDELDGDHLAGWVSSLSDAIRSLQTLKRKLEKELTRD